MINNLMIKNNVMKEIDLAIKNVWKVLIMIKIVFLMKIL